MERDMFYLPTSVLEKMPPLLIAGVFSLGVVLALILIPQTFNDRSKMIENYESSQALWLSDCAAMTRPIDDCTLAWAKNGVLRDVYLKKFP